MSKKNYLHFTITNMFTVIQLFIFVENVYQLYNICFDS